MRRNAYAGNQHAKVSAIVAALASPHCCGCRKYCRAHPSSVANSVQTNLHVRLYGPAGLRETMTSSAPSRSSCEVMAIARPTSFTCFRAWLKWKSLS